MTEIFGFLITLVVVLFWTAILAGGVLVVLGILVGLGIGIMAVIERLK